MTQAPSFLNTLLGNQAVKNHLQQMSSLPSAMLFSGPAGVGKATFAKAFAQARLGRAGHPDLILLEPEGKSQMHPIENIRNLIQRLAIPPYEAPITIVIIDSADRMLPYAANALLKTLEEPPTYAHLILTSSHSDRLLPTIRSRCQVLPFQPLKRDDLQAFFTQRNTSQNLDALITLSQGSLSRAEKLLSGDLNLEPIFDYLENNKPLTGDAEELLPLLQYWYRDRHLLAAGANPSQLFYKEHLDRLKAHVSRPLPSLESLHLKLADALEATHRGIKLSALT
ncbi:MAG: AAA family ATPase [Chlamydiia bacterium]|nr:AAA family ATPase [Chlamydiia bacterium]